MVIEQLYGGPLDGTEIHTEGHPAYVSIVNGMKFYRRSDGKLYADGCRWDNIEPERTKS